MKEQLTIEQCLQESWDFLNGLQNQLFGGPDSMGTYWNRVGGAEPLNGNYNSILRYFNTPFFNRIQRWQGEFLYKTNCYAISAVDNLVNLIIGEGFKYVSDDPFVQSQLDEWLEINHWELWQREAYTKLFVEGETFIRCFDNGDDPGTIRFILPDAVYDPNNATGIDVDDDDYTIVTSYTVNNTKIKAEEIEHMKLGWSNELRGTSLLYSMSKALISAESLLQTLGRTADQLGRIAYYREHDSTKEAVSTFRSDIQGQQRAAYPDASINSVQGCTNENIEYVPAGAIMDVPKNVKLVFPGQGIQAEQFVSVLRAILRMAAARAGLPENILSQDMDSTPAYNGALVANSHIVKGLEAYQRKFIYWEKQILKKCGIDISKVNILASECAVHDKKQLVDVADFLIRNQIASKSTLGKMFEVDYEAELEQIVLEPVTEPPANNGNNKTNDSGVNTSGGN